MATNPFVGVPVGDYLRDAGALFCLLAAFSMPWDISNDSADRWWVTISLLLSMLSLALPYVGAARVIPGWTPTHVRLAKLAANAPFAASVVAALVNELVNVGDSLSGGIGSGVAMGTAGVLFAVQPRRVDENLGDDRLWWLIGQALAAAALAVGVLSFLAYLLDDVLNDRLLTNGVLRVAILLVGYLAVFLAVVGWPTVRIFARLSSWRRVYAVVGFTVLATALLAQANDGDSLLFALPYEKWNFPFAGTFLLAAAAAVMVSRPAHRVARAAVHPVQSWIDTATAALTVSAAAVVLSAVSLVLSMLDAGDFTASSVVIAVLMIGTAVIDGIVISLLSAIQRTRLVALSLLGASLLLGVITLAVIDSQGLPLTVDGWRAAMWFGLPALAAFALVGPAPVRSALGPLVTERSTQPQQAPPPAYPPSQQPSPPRNDPQRPA